jgi:putative transposase
MFFIRKRISEFIVDETLLKVGSEYVWLWVAIEQETRQILSLYPYLKRETYVCSRKISFRFSKDPWKASCIH